MFPRARNVDQFSTRTHSALPGPLGPHSPFLILFILSAYCLSFISWFFSLAKSQKGSWMSVNNVLKGKDYAYWLSFIFSSCDKIPWQKQLRGESWGLGGRRAAKGAPRRLVSFSFKQLIWLPAWFFSLPRTKFGRFSFHYWRKMFGRTFNLILPVMKVLVADTNQVPFLCVNYTIAHNYPDQTILRKKGNSSKSQTQRSSYFSRQTWIPALGLSFIWGVRLCVFYSECTGPCFCFQ